MTTYKIFKIICEKNNNEYIYFTKEKYLSNVLSSFKKKVKKPLHKYNELFINPTIHIMEIKKNIECIELIKEYTQEIINKTNCINNPKYKKDNKPVNKDETIIKKKEEIKIKKFNKILKQQQIYREKPDNKDKKKAYDKQRYLLRKEKKETKNNIM